MHIRLRAPVIAADGARVGRIERVLIDLPSQTVRHVVVGRHMLARGNWSVPFHHIAPDESDDEAVHLIIPEGEVHELPEYVDADAVRQSSTGAAGEVPRVTAFGDLSAPQISDVERVDPAAQSGQTGHVVLSASTDIISRDGRNLGRLADIDCDEDGRLRDVAGRARIFHHGEVRIDAQEIVSISSRQIHVVLSANEARGTTPPLTDSQAAEIVSLPLAAARSGMTVKSPTGVQLGQVDAVERTEDEVHAIVVRHGLFGRRRKRLIPDVVSGVTQDAVTLTIERQEFKLLPDLDN